MSRPTTQQRAPNRWKSDRSDRLRQLHRVTVRLNSRTRVEDLLEEIIETAATLLESQAASLLLFDSEAEVLRFAAASGSDPATLQQIEVPLTGSIAGDIFRTGRTRIVGDIDQSSDHFDGVDRQSGLKTTSLLGVPLHVEGERTGVLEVMNRHRGGYSSEDAELLEMLAEKAALAIRNARQREEVESMLTRLTATDAFRTQFLALASHELRTPLTEAIQSVAILREEVEGPSEDFARMAADALDRMERIIGTISQLELLREDRSEAEASSVQILEVLRSFCGRVPGRMVHVSCPKEAVLTTDATYFRRIVEKLFDNACQFSDSDVFMDADPRDGGIEIRIRDGGIGLRPSDLERVFEEFHQVEPHLTRERGGLGVGLTIARRLATVLGGQIGLRSEGLGQGCEAWVWLPGL